MSEELGAIATVIEVIPKRKNTERKKKKNCWGKLWLCRKIPSNFK